MSAAPLELAWWSCVGWTGMMVRSATDGTGNHSARIGGRRGSHLRPGRAAPTALEARDAHATLRYRTTAASWWGHSALRYDGLTRARLCEEGSAGIYFARSRAERRNRQTTCAFRDDHYPWHTLSVSTMSAAARACPGCARSARSSHASTSCTAVSKSGVIAPCRRRGPTTIRSSRRIAASSPSSSSSPPDGIDEDEDLPPKKVPTPADFFAVRAASDADLAEVLALAKASGVEWNDAQIEEEMAKAKHEKEVKDLEEAIRRN